jgi:hypothetical protein
MLHLQQGPIYMFQPVEMSWPWIPMKSRHGIDGGIDVEPAYDDYPLKGTYHGLILGNLVLGTRL